MKVRAISNHYGDDGYKSVGDVYTVSASKGKELIANKVAEEIETEKEEIEPAKEKKEVKHTSKKEK